MKPINVYLAADTLTPPREEVVPALVDQGHCVYDPVRPLTVEQLEAGVSPDASSASSRFSWSGLSENYGRDLSSREVRDALSDPDLVRSYDRDLAAMRWCDVVILVLPSPEGAMLAAGYAVGLRKRVYAFMPDGVADTWLSMFDQVLVSERELADLLADLSERQVAVEAVKQRLMDDGDYE